MIALDIVAGLESAGVAVEGQVGSVEDALRAIESMLDLMARCWMPICGASP